MVRIILLFALVAVAFWLGRRWQARADKPYANVEKDITPRRDDDKRD